MINFVEFGFKLSQGNPLEDINKLINAIKKMNDLAESKSKYIMLVDEVEITKDNYDYSNLELQIDEIDLFIAFNPSSTFSKHESKVMLSQDSSSIIEQLRFKHRYSTEIGIFNLHLTVESDGLNKSWNWSEDAALFESTFPSARYPLLILVAEGLQDEVIFETVNEYLMPNDKNELIWMIDYELDEERKKEVESLCQSKSWKMVESHDMTGSEAAVVVLFLMKEDMRSFEYHSRARNLLIIVQEYVFCIFIIQSFTPFFAFLGLENTTKI